MEAFYTKAAFKEREIVLLKLPLISILIFKLFEGYLYIILLHLL